MNKREVMVSIEARHSVDGDGACSVVAGDGRCFLKYRGKEIRCSRTTAVHAG